MSDTILTDGAYVDLNFASGGYKPYHSAPKLRREFYAKTFLSEVMTREYEGMLKKFGDTVKVRRRAEVTGSAYTKGADITYAQFQSPASVDLVIDSAYQWNFYLEDLDRLQSDLKGFEAEWQDDAVNKTRTHIETAILDAAPANVSAYNKGLTAGKKTASFNLGSPADPLHLTGKETTVLTNGTLWNASDLFADFNTVLNENLIDPSIERFVICPSFVANKVAKTAVKQADITGDQVGVIRTGPNNIGKVNGIMNTYQSELFTQINGGPTGSTKVFPVLFGVKDAWTFAMQVESIDAAFKLEKRYGRAWRGLNVWGWKMMVPEAMGVAYVTNDALGVV